MAEDKTIEAFTKQLEAFQNGFKAIAENLSTQLTGVLTQVTKLAENTTFMPKVMNSNKEIKKTGEQLQMLVDTLLARLDSVCEDKGYM